MNIWILDRPFSASMSHMGASQERVVELLLLTLIVHLYHIFCYILTSLTTRKVGTPELKKKKTWIIMSARKGLIYSRLRTCYEIKETFALGVKKVHKKESFMGVNFSCFLSFFSFDIFLLEGFTREKSLSCFMMDYFSESPFFQTDLFHKEALS